MSENELHSLRMVIQQIGIEPAYRVVVYGDWEKSRHADFNSRHVLMEALRAALPDFDMANLCLDPLHEGQGSMVFAGEIKVNNRQLGLLGLR